MHMLRIFRCSGINDVVKTCKHGEYRSIIGYYYNLCKGTKHIKLLISNWINNLTSNQPAKKKKRLNLLPGNNVAACENQESLDLENPSPSILDAVDLD